MASPLPPMSRRAALRAAAALAAWPLSGVAGLAVGRETQARAVTRGRLRQSVSRWCYKDIPLPDLCRAVAAMGVPAIDLLEAADWPVVREHGLVCSMGYGGGGHHQRRPQQPRQSRPHRRQPHRGDAEGGGDRRAQPDHLLRQSPGPRRPRGDRRLHRRPEPAQGRGRAARRDHLRGAAEQQGRTTPTTRATARRSAWRW